MNAPILSPEEAQQIVLSKIVPLGVERVSLIDALGRLVANDIVARHDNPPLDNSAMDGYAVRHEDVRDASASAPARLAVVEEIPAGSIPLETVGQGQASRIMTGAPLPAGADTVVRIEDTQPQPDRVDILAPEPMNGNVRRRGEDIQAGATLIAAGTCCESGELGVLAAQQYPVLPVYRRPTAAILSTGDELVDLSEPLQDGKIVDSNTYALAALCRSHGALPWMLPIVRDTEEATRQAVETALAADFILSSGGVSVGEYDFVKKVLDEMGAEAGLWRVSMKPGKPLFFCTLRNKPYFGLPGNPVSSMMSFLQFVRPAIRKASCYPEDEWLLPQTTAIMEHDVKNRGERRDYLRARLTYERGVLKATAFKRQGSHMLTSMLGANGIVVLGPSQSVAKGAEATVQIIRRIL